MSVTLPSYDDYMAEQRKERGWTSMADSTERLFPSSEIMKYDPVTWAFRLFGGAGDLRT